MYSFLFWLTIYLAVGCLLELLASCIIDYNEELKDKDFGKRTFSMALILFWIFIIPVGIYGTVTGKAG